MTLLRLLVATAALIYAAAVVGFMAAEQLLSDSVSWIALASDLTVLVFLPLPPLLVLSTLVWSRASFALLIIPVLIFGSAYGTLFLPGREKPAGNAGLVVRSHNLLDGNRDVGSEWSAIESQRPDVVFLQELGQPFASELENRLGTDYPYRMLDAGSGMGILSRRPMEYLGCRRPTSKSDCWQLATIDVDGESVAVINVHAQHPSISRRGQSGIRAFLPRAFDVGLREAEMRGLVDWLGSIRGPVVVAGDFNMTPHSAGYGIVAGRLRDVHRSVGFGFGHTFPADLSISHFDIPPLLRIDYVFVSPDIDPRRIEVGGSGGSDHLAVTASLGLRPGG